MQGLWFWLLNSLSRLKDQLDSPMCNYEAQTDVTEIRQLLFLISDDANVARKVEKEK